MNRSTGKHRYGGTIIPTTAQESTTVIVPSRARNFQQGIPSTGRYTKGEMMKNVFTGDVIKEIEEDYTQKTANRKTNVYWESPEGKKELTRILTKGSKYTDKKDLGGILKSIGGFAKDAVPYLGSIAGTALNLNEVNKVKTTRRPIMARYNPTAYKDPTQDIVNRNEAAYSGFINNNNSGIGSANRAVAFGKMLDANTQAGISGANAQNQFNQNESRTQAGINMQNAQIANQVGRENYNRYNDKIAARSNAIQAGTQDLINIDTNRRAANAQADEMLMKFAETADLGTMERKAMEMGFENADEMMQVVGDPNVNTAEYLKRKQRRMERQGIKRNRYSPMDSIDPADEMN
jgi:hypothetical protein